MTGIRDQLARDTCGLIDIPSESRYEARIADHIWDMLAGMRLPAMRVTRYGNSVLTIHDVPRASSSRPFIWLVGHVDTVPAQANMPARLRGDVIEGLGAADMKGALAVMIALARWMADERPPLRCDVGLLFYDKEEIGLAESGLTPLFAAFDDLERADLAVVMEPTGGEIQVGCLGNIQADVTFCGKSCHSARPWLGENAIHKGIAALAELSRSVPSPDEVDGFTYVEVCNVTRIKGGLAANVIPDEMRVHVNYRYSPSRTPEEAETHLRSLLAGDEIAITANGPAARPCVGNPLVKRLQASGDLVVAPKQAWTDVAQFEMHGVDAVNFGPGDPAFAHTRDEQVSLDALEASYEILQQFILEV